MRADGYTIRLWLRVISGFRKQIRGRIGSGLKLAKIGPGSLRVNVRMQCGEHRELRAEVAVEDAQALAVGPVAAGKEAAAWPAAAARPPAALRLPA